MIDIKARVARLTPRQREVVRLASLGCTITEIAAILDVAPSTVDNHRSRAMHVLAIDRAATLTRVAIKYKVSSIDDELSPLEQRRSGRHSYGVKRKKARKTSALAKTKRPKRAKAKAAKSAPAKKKKSVKKAKASGRRKTAKKRKSR